MAEVRKVTAFSAADMKRRRTRNLIMALALAAFIVIIFITTVLKISGALHG